MSRSLSNRMRDVVFNQPLERIRVGTFSMLSKTQRWPEAHLVGSAIIVIMICKHYGLRVNEVMDMAGKVIHNSLSYTGDPKGHLRATWEYIKNELPT